MAVLVDEEMITNGSYNLVTQGRQINIIMKNRPLINLKVFNSTNSISIYIIVIAEYFAFVLIGYNFM